MAVRHDARLARSVFPQIAKGVVKNLSVDIAAKFSHRTYPGVADTTFDPFDAATATNPYPGYRELLAGPRVHFNRRRGIFILSRHEDVRAAARADALLSSREGVVRSRVEVPVLLNLDRPRHTELRRKVQPAFARGSLQSWQPMVDRLARELVADLVDHPRSDVVQSLAMPMPMRMIAYILGVPPEDEKFFRRWSNEAIRVANVQSTPRGLGQIAPTFYGVRQLHTYFRTQLEKGAWLRSETESDTVMGRLVANTEAGEITAEELFFFVLLLLLAGNETTTNLLGAMFLVLSENPDQLELIRADPDGLLGSAVEELLRYVSPIQGFYRTALREYPIGDTVIPANSRVALLWGAANRDPRVYENPDAFVAARNPTNHVAFGSGIHLCLGAGLARMEGKAILREVIERVDRIEVGTPTWTTNSSLRGLKQMEVTLHAK